MVPAVTVCCYVLWRSFNSEWQGAMWCIALLWRHVEPGGLQDAGDKMPALQPGLRLLDVEGFVLSLKTVLHKQGREAQSRKLEAVCRCLTCHAAATNQC